MNKVILLGRLVEDPEANHFMPTESTNATLHITTSEGDTSNAGNLGEPTECHPVVVSDPDQAKSCMVCLSKGSLVLIEGSLQTRKRQDKHGQDYYITNIKVSCICFLDPIKQIVDRVVQLHLSNSDYLENILECVPKELKTLNFWFDAVQQDGWALGCMPNELITPELCLAAVQQNGWAIECVPDELITPELCLAAVQQDGWVIESVSDKFKTPELCLVAVKEDIGAYFINDEDHLKNLSALEYVPDELKTSDICLAAVQQNAIALKYVPEALKTSEFYLAIVQKDGWSLRFIPEEVCTLELCLVAVQQNPEDIQHVPSVFRTWELCLAAVQQEPKMIKYIPYPLRTRKFYDAAKLPFSDEELEIIYNSNVLDKNSETDSFYDTGWCYDRSEFHPWGFRIEK